jgi:hypothetical protein
MGYADEIPVFYVQTNATIDAIASKSVVAEITTHEK